MNSVIKAVLTQFKQHGYEAYVIGGFVRDLVLGIHSDDIDIATNATPQQVKEIFDHTIDVGIAHGSVTVIIDHQSFDITTFRSDGAYSNHRRPDHVVYDVSLEMDVSRRDFTMNAIAMNLEGEIIDLVGGKEAIRQRRITAIGDPYTRMQEDALRIIRALRFVSVLGFELDDDLVGAMRQHQHLVASIAMERIQVEVRKLLQGSYLDKMNHYLSNLSIPLLPPQFINNPSLSLVEQLVIAEHKYPSFQSTFMLTKQERKQFLYLRELSADRPDSYEMYGSPYPHSLIQVGSIVFGWDQQSLIDQYENLSIHQREELAINGRDIEAIGLKGPAIESMLIEIEKALITQQIQNNKKDILAYAKEQKR